MHLFDQNEASMFVVVVSRLVEMFIENASVRTFYFITMGVNSEVHGWFAFSNVLICLAQAAEDKINIILTPAIESVPYLKYFTCFGTTEGLC